MENIRVIKLNPNTYISNVSTFDDAFDEYSFANGKRRAKRQQRKLDKQKAKKELLEAKAETKKAKVGKRTAKKVAKQERRDTISSMRQARKTARAEDIQARRTGRRQARLDRRAMGEEFEPEIDETTQGTEDDTIINDVNDTNQDINNGGQYDDSQIEDGQYDGEYAPEQDEWGAEPDYTEDDSDVNESNDEPQYGDEYDSYQNDEEDLTANGFDGTISNDEEFFDLEQASQVIEVPEAITVVADKIEWNKELYSRIEGKKKEILEKDPSANIDELDSKLSDRADRIVDLENLLDGWANCKYNYDANNQFEEFPHMDIDYSNAEGIDKINKMKRKRYKQLSKAKDNAKKKREKITVVKTTLNPIIQKGKIVIPSKSNFEGIPEGTGLNGLDNSNDFDAPPVIDVELTSNASGSESKINIGGVILGIGIAVIGIWAIRKYKLIK